VAFQVVCISRTAAAGGEPLGQALAERLGFRYVDEEVIERGAERARITAEELASIERKPPVIKRVMDAIGLAPVDKNSMGGLVRRPMDFDYYAVRGLPPQIPSDHRMLIRQAIHDIAAEGRVVIVAHAASMALAARTDALRILVTASPEVRAARLDLKSSDEAKAVIARDDEGRRDYLQRFYEVPRELPTHYDLVLNTDKLTPDQVLAIVMSVAGAT